MLKESSQQTVSSSDRNDGNADSSRLVTPGPKSLLADETINSIIEQLLAQGLSIEEIVMPGSGTEQIAFIANDFDAPSEDFSDYM